MSWKHLCKTSWRCLVDAFARRLEDVLKTFWRCLGKTSRRFLEDDFARRLEDVLKTYGQDKYIGFDQDARRRMSKTNIFVLIKTSWRSLQDIFWRRRRKTSSRPLQDIFIKTNVLLGGDSIGNKIADKILIQNNSNLK